MVEKTHAIFPNILEFDSLYFKSIRHSYNHIQVFTSINTIMMSTFTIISNTNGKVWGSYLIWLRLDKTSLVDLQRNVKQT